MVIHSPIFFILSIYKIWQWCKINTFVQIFLQETYHHNCYIWKALSTLWTDSICLFKCSFGEKFASQSLHLIVFEESLLQFWSPFNSFRQLVLSWATPKIFWPQVYRGGVCGGRRRKMWPPKMDMEHLSWTFVIPIFCHSKQHPFTPPSTPKWPPPEVCQRWPYLRVL